EELAPPRFYPAVAQGALGIEYRSDRPELDELLGFLDHPASRVCVEAERAFLFALDGGCQVPIAGHAVLDDTGRMVELTGLVADLSGETIILRSGTAKVKDAATLGASVAQEVLGAGGRAILEAVYRQDA
ncbi:MAG: hydroxymethylbilane synthase, partial [Desulfomicrobiaceae bacterium]